MAVGYLVEDGLDDQPLRVAYAEHLRDTGHTIADIVAKTSITRTSLYRYLPPRPAEALTASDETAT